MADFQRQISRLMHRVRQRGGLPSSAAIVRETFERLGYVPGAIEPEDVIGRFVELLRRVWEETLPTLEQYEERSYAQGIPRELIDEFPHDLAAAELVASEQGFRAGMTRLFRACPINPLSCRQVKG